MQVAGKVLDRPERGHKPCMWTSEELEMDRRSSTCRGSVVIRESGMIEKEQRHRVLGATVRILGLSRPWAESEGEMP